MFRSFGRSLFVQGLTGRMRRKSLVLLGVLLVTGCAVGFLLYAKRARREQEQRDLTHYWTRSMQWWNYDLTESENRHRGIARLKTLGDVAIHILSLDLRARGGVSRWIEKLPFVSRYFSRSPGLDEAENLRTAAAVHLGELGPAAKPAVSELLRVLGGDTERVQMTAAFALGQIGDSSPSAIAALERGAKGKSPNVAFSSELSLWMLTHTEERRQRVESLVGGTPSWAALCLGKLGPEARPFVPALRQIRDRLPCSDTKMQVVSALWEITGEKKEVLQTLLEIGRELDHPTSTNDAGWTSGESTIATAAHTLDDEPEFRTSMRPLLEKALASSNPQVVRMARVYLEKHAKLNQAKGAF